MSLQEQLKAKYEEIKKNAPNEVAIFDADTESFISSGDAPQGLQVGDQLASFELPNQLGQTISLDELQGDSNIVISFYRGGWCPYCNIELCVLQQALPEFKSHGARLIAISPQLPDESMSTAEKNELSFPVLSDAGNKVAREFGLVFTLSEQLRPLYESFNIDLPATNGDKSFELPIPATFIIDSDGVVKGAFVNADYKQRMDLSDIINVLKEIKS
jgi:peroxiredoxin|tara:strand:+ start:227 stop:874 length:648 start_codon:yes stop_codon:yes gene_type:complete